MDYNYETLLDQRFQKLCQALLLKEYDSVQCFPVGMADGGRDATSNSTGKLETVFQVKFTHKPDSIKNVAKWITGTLDGELEKIHRLKELGATRYILITNAFPTANLGSGAIDKVNEYMAEHIPMEASCWWRDDLDRRLDGNYDVKLSYPSVMSGPDMLRLLWENAGSNEDAQRRKMALSAYFAHQAEQDATIRFKQAELLPSSLLELFIDVPAIPHDQYGAIDSPVLNSYLKALYSQDVPSSMRVREARRRLEYLLQRSTDDTKPSPRLIRTAIRDVGSSVGAADLLLNEQFLGSCPLVVLEGAPGQGKSTLSQYLAQIQRLRILDRSSDVARIHDSHAASPVMLPFKIELRDLASWIKGEDPWSGNPHDRHDLPRTLEGAISGHIERYSGGFTFNVADMAFMAQSRPVLIILDALDEVADLEDRRAVVDEVVAAVARLSQGAKTLKVLVTSRPTAVSGAPSFPPNKFAYLTLAAIPRKLGLEYAQKWSRARNIRKSDAAEISQILTQKMSAPHMAELAKNTMQLSILLSLIYHRGSSLPDKRTELYDAYVDSFFNREVEKSKVVRENRMLLIGMHQHLAFYMHARAESDRTTGRIGVEELKQVLKDYLVKQQESVSVLEDLLTGMVERVVALVSRVEGTYEFEVQPLREYFAARHLYDTAPYVSATRMGHGTKPDRFDGIARNPYWMNVTRFFAGCFTKGELLDLAERVCSLCDLPDMKGDKYPRNLALALLQDWVFSQSKPATEKVIDKLYDTYGVRSFFVADSVRGRATPDSHHGNLSLSSETGSTYFVQSRLDALLKGPYLEESRALAYVMGRQPKNDKDTIRHDWQECYRTSSPERRVDLIRIARWANLFHADMDIDLFRNERDLRVLLAMVDVDFAGDLIPHSLHGPLALTSLNGASQFTLYSSSLNGGITNSLAVTRLPLWYYSAVHRYSGVFAGELSAEEPKSQSETMRILREIAIPVVNPTVEIHENYGIWREFLIALKDAFGETWAGTLIGLLSGAVRAPQEKGARAEDLFSDDHPFCDRVRHARRRRGQAAWWTEQLSAAHTAEQKELWMATAFGCASGDVLTALFEDIETLLAGLSEESISRLVELAANKEQISVGHSGDVKFPSSWVRQAPLNSPMFAIFFNRLEAGPQKDRILSKRASGLELNSEFLATALRYGWSRWAQGFLSERQIIAANKKLYRAGVFTPLGISLQTSLDRRTLRSHLEVFLSQVDNMPDMIVEYIESELRRMATRRKPVLRVAEKEKWFA
ncbi:NACHT domain-containing protein [Streptomyces geranii]|uniref:NACHT domain-containing protein n=1 Tax=Streptomyces geranii TaxID=2058923 RepID=UPI000D0407C4|nr:NACHT domain-containing protein [Streptomyces geranii]